jgi:1,4-dihydroxy-2-naphthoyl-CoA hydrolase
MAAGLMLPGPSTATEWLRIEGVDRGAGEAVLRLPTRPEMANRSGVVHGGFIALLADSAMSRALGTMLPEGERHASFDLKLSFIAPARIGEALEAVAKVLHSGRRTGVVECRVEASGDRLVATGTATFIIYLPESQS